MTALIKKPVPNERMIWEGEPHREGVYSTTLGIMEQVRTDGHARLSLHVTETQAVSKITTLAYPITHVQDLDDLILALTALRETYQ